MANLVGFSRPAGSRAVLLRVFVSCSVSGRVWRATVEGGDRGEEQASWQGGGVVDLDGPFIVVLLFQSPKYWCTGTVRRGGCSVLLGVVGGACRNQTGSRSRLVPNPNSEPTSSGAFDLGLSTSDRHPPTHPHVLRTSGGRHAQTRSTPLRLGHEFSSHPPSSRSHVSPQEGPAQGHHPRR